MNRTSIEWVRNPDGTQGYTWNPITGCLNGCEYCYARKLANTRLKERYLANPLTSLKTHKEATLGEYERQRTDPFYPRFWEDRLEELRQRNRKLIERGLDKPRGIFPCDMSDLFGIGIPEEWTEAILNEMDNKHDRFYLLTKQPQNLIKWSPFPENCRVGVTATGLYSFINAHNYLISIEAKIKYISFEPLLSWGKCEEQHACELDYIFKVFGDYPHNVIDWVIIGAQTKPYKPPKIEWVREIVEACDKAGIPVFLKNNLKPLFQSLMRVPNMSWWGNVFGLRQELPGISLNTPQKH